MEIKVSHSQTRREFGLAMAAGFPMAAGLAMAASIASPRPAEAKSAVSTWSRGMHSRMRLSVAGRATATGPLVGAVEIGLDPGFKTYWRVPGDSGVPPIFDFAGSENVRDIETHFPAPFRFDDGAGGHSFGYKGLRVELPVTFRPIDPTKPSRLVLKLDYAVCDKICVPASGQADVTIMPAASGVSQDATRLLDMLPRRQDLGAAGAISVLKLAKGNAAEHFVVEAALPADAKSDLFIEAASPWLFDAKPPQPYGEGRARFAVLAVERDRTPDCKGVEIRLTLVAGSSAIECTTWLDVSLLAP